jgi:hypothetical protein
MPKGMQAIYTQTVSGTPGTVTFNNIPQTYTDLLVKISARSSVSAANSEMYITYNGDLGSNYSTTWLTGNGSSASSSRGSNNGAVVTIQINGATSTSNTFGSIDVYTPNYTSSLFKQTTVEGVIENNTTAHDSRLISYLYRSNAPLTSTTFSAVGGAFVAGSTFTLYGISR